MNKFKITRFILFPIIVTADFFVKININNNIESLNISNSASIAFHFINYKKIND